MYRNIYIAIYFICWFFNLLNAACLYNKETQNVKREKESFKFRIYNNNIRAERTNLEPFERPWSERKDAAIAAMLENCLKVPTIITLQDALLSQVNDIKNGLNENKGTSWTYFGYGADDGAQAGKFNPIFYDSTQWTLDSGRQRWFSMSPSEPSRYPPATNNTTIIEATLIHKATGNAVNILNTQLDDKHEDTRQLGALDLRVYAEKSMLIGHPTVVTGDFNSNKSDRPYKYISNPRWLVDCSRYEKPESKNFFSTFSGFSGPEGETTDFIFADIQTVLGSNYEIIDNKSKDGTYRFSNHRPVIVDFLYLNQERDV